MNKKMKVLNSAVAITGIASAGLAGVLLAIHEKSKVKTNYQYNFLREYGQVTFAEEQLLEYLKENMDPETNSSLLSKEVEEEVLNLLKELQENRKNPNMDSVEAQKIKDKIDHELAYAKLKEAISKESSENISKAIDEIVNQIKDPEIRAQFLETTSGLTDSIKNGSMSKEDKLKLAEKLKETTQSLYDKQSEILAPTQQTLWKLKDELKNNSGYFKPEQKAKAEAIINTLEAALENNLLTAENADELRLDLEKAYSELIEAKKETENEYQKYLEKSQNAKQSILNSNLSKVEKDKLLAKLESFDKQAASNDAKIANNKLDEIIFLEGEVDAIVNNLDDLNKDTQTLKDEITASINDASLDHGNLNKVLANALSDIQNELQKPNLSKEQILELKDKSNRLIKQAKSDQSSINNTKAMIEQALADGVLTSSQAAELHNKLNSIDGQNLEEISLDADAKIAEVVEKLVRAKNISDDIKTLESKANVRLNDQDANPEKAKALFNAIQALKNKSLDEWDNLDSENDKTWAGEDEVQKLYDQLRDLNKNELKNLISKGQELLSDPTISDEIKEKLRNLELRSTPLTNDYSASTNAQLEPRIEEYKRILEDSKLNKKVSDINKYTSQLKEKITNMSNENEQHTQAQILNDKVNEILNKINSIYSDPTKTNDEKEAQINALKEQLNSIEGKLTDLQKLMDQQKRLKDSIAALDANPEIKQQLLDEIQQANDLFDNQNDIFANPDGKDIDSQIQKLKDLEDTIRTKQNNLNSDQYYKKALAALNSAFAPYRSGIIPSELETKLRDELEKQKLVLDDPNSSPSQYYAAIEKIKALQENIKPAADLEKKRRELKDTIQRTHDTNSQLNPSTQKTDVAEAEAKLNQINDFINDLTVDGATPNLFNTLKDDADEQIQTLKVEQEKSKLRDSIGELVSFITPSDDTDSEEYKELAKSITENINQEQAIADDVANNSNNIASIKDMKSKVDNVLPLAEKIKEAQLRFKELNDPKYKVIADQLQEVLKNNKISLNDTPEKINAKIKAITEELNKIQTKKEIIDQLEQMEQVYSESDSDKAIFAESKPALDNKIAAFREQLTKGNLSSSDLSQLKRDINKANQLGKIEKARLEKELSDQYDEAEVLYNQLKEEALTKRGMSESDLSRLESVWNEIKQLKDADGNFVNSATPSQIKKLKEKMNLEYLKGVFEFKKSKVEAKLKTFPETTAYENETEKPTDKLKNAINSTLESWTEGVNDSSDQENLKEYIAKLDSLNTYADESKDLLDEYSTNNNEKDIIDAINSNLVNSSDTLNNINDKTAKLAQARIDAMEQEKYRTKTQNKTQELKDKLDALNQEWANNQLKNGDDSLQKEVEKLLEKVKNATSKAEIADVENKIKALNQNFDEIQILASKTEEVNKAIKDAFAEEGMSEDPILKAFQKRFENDLQAKAKAQYNNPEITEITNLKEETASYLSTLKSIKEFNKDFSNATKKLQALNYPEGFGNISDQEFKLNSQSASENFSTLTNENVKAGMQVSLDTYKYFAEKINYPQEPMLDIKKEINYLQDSLSKFSELLDDQKTEIEEKYNVVKAKEENSSEFSNLHPENVQIETFKYELDTKHIGEAILNSAIISKTSNGQNDFSSLSFDQMYAKYVELNNSITALTSANANQDQKTIVNLNSKLAKITNELNTLVNKIKKEENDLSILILKLEIEEEKQTEIAAQESYGKTYTQEQKEQITNEISSLKSQILSKKQAIQDKKQELTSKQEENKQTFYDLKFVEFKIKEIKDQINALADALYIKSFEKPEAEQMDIRNIALRWKNDLIVNKRSVLSDDVVKRNDLFSTRDKKVNEIKLLAGTLNEKLTQSANVLPGDSTNKSVERYKVFNTKISNIAVQMLDYIKKSTSIDDLDQYAEFINSLKSKFEDYKTIADKIYNFELAIAEVENNEYMKNNKHMISLINQLKSEIQFVKGQLKVNSQNIDAFVSLSSSQNVINEWKKILDFQLNKLEFYKKYIAQQKILDTYKEAENTENNPANSDNVWFNSSELAPLQAILNNAFTDLYNADYLTEDDLNNLETEYFTGDVDSSITVARANSVTLKNAVKVAQEIYNARKVDDSGNNNDTPDMNKLYVELKEAIDEGQRQLTKPVHDELNKTLAYDQINNPSVGKIVRLRDQKFKELLEQISIAEDINVYVTQNYKNIESAKLEGFEQKAIEELKEAKKVIQTAEFISNANEKITQSKEQIKQQLFKVFEYENNSLKSLIVRSKQYVKVFKLEDTYLKESGVNLQEFKKLFGIDDQKLNEIITIINEIETQMEKNLNNPYNQSTALTWNIEDEYSNASSGNYTEEQYTNYSNTIEEIKQQKKKLNSKYTLIKQLATVKLKTFKLEFDEVKSELEASGDNNSDKLGLLIQNLGFNDAHETLGEGYVTSTNKDNFVNSEAFGENAQNTNIDEPISDAAKETLIDSKEKFIKYAKAILETNTKFNKYIFGDDADDKTALKNTYTTYINKRSDISVFLKFLVGETNQNNYNADPEVNTLFSKFLKAFNVQKDQAQALKTQMETEFVKQELDAENLNTPSMSLLKIKRMLSSARTFRDWLNSAVNKADLFDYLYKRSEIDPTSFNYNDLELKVGKYSDDWVEKVQKLETNNPEKFQDLVVNGETMKAFKITNEDYLDELFERFSLLEQKENQIFNKDNFEIWIYKDPKVTSSKYLEEIFQVNPTYKNLKYNIYIKYKNEAARGTVFADVGDVITSRPNTQTRFNTFSSVIIDNKKVENFYQSGPGKYDRYHYVMTGNYFKRPENAKYANIFDYQRGGLAPNVAPGIIISGFSEVQNIFPNQEFLTLYPNNQIDEMLAKEYTLDDLTSDKLFTYDSNLRYIKQKVDAISDQTEKEELFKKLIKEYKRNLSIQKDRINISITPKNDDVITYWSNQTKGNNDPKFKVASDVVFWKLIQPDNYGVISYIPQRIGIPIYDPNTKVMGLLLFGFQFVPSSSADWMVGAIYSQSLSWLYLRKTDLNEFKYEEPVGTEEEQAAIRRRNQEKAVRIANDMLPAILDKNSNNYSFSKTYTRWNFGTDYLKSEDNKKIAFATTGYTNTFNTNYKIKIYKSDIELESESE